MRRVQVARTILDSGQFRGQMLLATKSQFTTLRGDVKEMTANCAAESCSKPLCPLSQVRAGTSVRIKQLSAPAEVTTRLREMGFCEEQCIRLVSRQAHYVCQVCHARIGLTSQLADLIMVEPIPSVFRAA
jgi:Fe2+ transport system protein FeoA